MKPNERAWIRRYLDHISERNNYMSGARVMKRARFTKDRDAVLRDYVQLARRHNHMARICRNASIRATT